MTKLWPVLIGLTVLTGCGSAPQLATPAAPTALAAQAAASASLTKLGESGNGYTVHYRLTVVRGSRRIDFDFAQTALLEDEEDITVERLQINGQPISIYDAKSLDVALAILKPAVDSLPAEHRDRAAHAVHNLLWIATS